MIHYDEGTDLEEVGDQVSDEGGEGEHEEDHQEAHAGPDTCEVCINTAESELAALVNRG